MKLPLTNERKALLAGQDDRYAAIAEFADDGVLQDFRRLLGQPSGSERHVICERESSDYERR